MLSQSVLLRMSQSMKSLSVACDVDAAVRLRKIAKLWPLVAASANSITIPNILHRALDAYIEPTATESRRHVSYDHVKLDAVDRCRLRQLVELWPGLDAAMQLQLLARVEEAASVSPEEQEAAKAALWLQDRARSGQLALLQSGSRPTEFSSSSVKV
jgi:uncharacterized protein YecA (UPF0149 family)